MLMVRLMTSLVLHGLERQSDDRGSLSSAWSLDTRAFVVQLPSPEDFVHSGEMGGFERCCEHVGNDAVKRPHPNAAMGDGQSNGYGRHARSCFVAMQGRAAGNVVP